MPRTLAPRLEPRKLPLQARSTATVAAILQAAVQVLLKDGRAKLTTTRIAERAGVSVGTLYQYFPNKSSLLQALLKQQLDQVAVAVETACGAAEGRSLAEMAAAITGAFVRAKFRHPDASGALYAVSDDVEGKQIAQGMHTRAIRAMAAAFRTARTQTLTDPEAVAGTLLSAMAGVSRATLEKGLTRGSMAAMERELTVLVRAYLEASVADLASAPETSSRQST